MSKELPAWARKLLDRHPDAEVPTPDNPVPDWLEEELRETPLWAFIRGADDIRREHPYFLIEDVHRQPELMRGVLDLQPDLAQLAQRFVDDGIDHIVFTGCGSAFFNAILGAFVARHWAGVTTEAPESLEFSNYWLPTSPNTALIAQSATGGSFETLDAVRHANDQGMLTVGLTNTSSSPLESICDETVAFSTNQRCGPDVSVITTRLMMQYLWALELGRRNGTLSTSRADELDRAISEVPDVAEQFLNDQEDTVADIAETLKDQHALLLVGGGPNWFSAREGALKVEEECSMVCKAYRPAEYPHDAIALLSPDVTTTVIAPSGKSYERLRASLRTGQAAGSQGLAVVSADDDTIAAESDFTIKVPGSLDEMLFPPLATIVFQTLGYYLGIKRGYNPDTLRTDNLDHARAWLTAFPLGTH